MGAEKITPVPACVQDLSGEGRTSVRGLITGVRVKAVPDLTAEQRERFERLIVETGF